MENGETLFRELDKLLTERSRLYPFFIHRTWEIDI